MKQSELPELRERPLDKRRVLLENAMTFALWAFWIWATSHAAGDWRWLCAKYPRLPALLTAGAGAQALLLLALWLRSRTSLRPDEPRVRSFAGPGWRFERAAAPSAIGVGSPDLVRS